MNRHTNHTITYTLPLTYSTTFPILIYLLIELASLFYIRGFSSSSSSFFFFLFLAFLYSHTVNEYGPGFLSIMGIEFTYGQGISSLNTWMNGIHIRMNVDYGNPYPPIYKSTINSSTTHTHIFNHTTYALPITSTPNPSSHYIHEQWFTVRLCHCHSYLHSSLSDSTLCFRTSFTFSITSFFLKVQTELRMGGQVFTVVWKRFMSEDGDLFR